MIPALRTSKIDINVVLLILAGLGILGHPIGLIGQVGFGQHFFGLPLPNNTAKIFAEVGALAVNIALVFAVVRKSRTLCFPYVVYMMPYMFILLMLTTYMSHIFHCFKLPIKLSLPLLIGPFLSIIIVVSTVTGVLTYLKHLQEEEYKKQKTTIRNVKPDTIVIPMSLMSVKPVSLN